MPSTSNLAQRGADMISPKLLHRHILNAHHHHHHGRDVHTHGIGLAESKRSPALPSNAFLHRTILNVGQQANNAQSRRSVDDLDNSTGNDDDDSDRMINLLLTVLGFVFFSLIVISALVVIRRSRRQRAAVAAGTLPTYSETTRNPHNLTIETTHNGHSSVVVYGRDGHPMLQNPQSPPHSPDNVPEIRITFPDEQDVNGQQKSGRVLVVRVGENATVGLEPLQEEQLPVYEKEAKGQFDSIDMDQIGGLKDEKDRTTFR